MLRLLSSRITVMSWTVSGASLHCLHLGSCLVWKTLASSESSSSSFLGFCSLSYSLSRLILKAIFLMYSWILVVSPSIVALMLSNPWPPPFTLCTPSGCRTCALWGAFSSWYQCLLSICLWYSNVFVTVLNIGYIVILKINPFGH